MTFVLIRNLKEFSITIENGGLRNVINFSCYVDNGNEKLEGITNKTGQAVIKFQGYNIIAICQAIYLQQTHFYDWMYDEYVAYCERIDCIPDYLSKEIDMLTL